MSEKREKQRRPSNGRIRLAWTDTAGAYYQEKPRLLDCSESGLCVLLDRRIPPQTLVGVHSMEHGYITNAVVRHVTQKGMQFRTGMEFPSDVSGLGVKL